MSIEKTTISRDDRIYEPFPDVARLPSGKLICIYRESDGHTVRRFSNIVIRSSIDGGYTWSRRRALVEAGLNEDGVVLKWNSPRIQRMQDGRVLALCDVFPCPPDENTDLTNARTVFWWSEDGGETWSEPQHTPVFGIVPDRVVELPSGSWLLATTVRMRGTQYDRQGSITQITHRSEDGGRTWQGPFIVAHDERYRLCEGSTLLLPDGELICYMRENSHLGLPGFKAFSQDEGRTWEGVYETRMGGCHRPVAGLLPSGKILVTYRYLPAHSAKNTFAYLETVESAKTRDLREQRGIVLPLDHDRSARADGGYTGWAVLHDGRIFCVNYVVDDAPQAQVRGYWFDETDF